MFGELLQKVLEFLFNRFERLRQRSQNALTLSPLLKQRNYLRFDFFFGLFHG